MSYIMDQEDEPTIVVDTEGGKPKNVTRREFVIRWKNSITGLFYIMPADQVATIAKEVEAAAGKSWDETYEKQNAQ